MTDTKLYAWVVTLSHDDNSRLLQQLKPGFKHTINWNKYQSKVTMQTRSQYLDYLIDPSFQGVNRVFVLLLENNARQTVHTSYFLATIKMKDYKVMTEGRNFFDLPVKNDIRTYDNNRKIGTGQGGDCTIGCLLDYPYFKIYYKMIAKILRKREALDTDVKAIQQINFTGNLDQSRAKSRRKKRKKSY